MKATEAGVQHSVNSGLKCFSHWQLGRHPSGQIYCRNLGFENYHEIRGRSNNPKQPVWQAEMYMLFLHIPVSHGLPHGPQGPSSVEGRSHRLLKPPGRKEPHEQRLSKKNTLTNPEDRQEAFSEKAKANNLVGKCTSN